ncbi:N-acetylmuramoyl-L-alanine amidase-like domain-containing protein [Legionella nagasakiensis]|uniref:N-acetylmuramoyl-L-alanine amidase-like domain-containing protein n=1 Tax=Legionella nagasakiensis TaxID=535290 RepID=UPI001F5F12EF|nr:N-acetylmuramoyl-L-alanine amidase-like domain-containing protein [Legionella nagasakiensis]
MPISDMATRLEIISAKLLGKPYLLGALGEGSKGRYDQYPLYRMDAFDCETYVDTVLAVAFANNVSQFKQCIRKLRYRNGHVSFIDRNHFASLDWNKNNQQQGFLQDITTTIKNKKNQSVAKSANALIDKPGWYQHFTYNNIRLSDVNTKEQGKRLNELKRKGRQLQALNASISYIPLSALFDSSGKANEYLFKQIPNAAIIEIIRPNWDLREKIGTCLNVSHLGFAFWKQGTLMFRQASSIQNHTVDVSLIDYLRDARKSPTIDGINIQVVLPNHPLPPGCHAE